MYAYEYGCEYLHEKPLPSSVKPRCSTDESKCFIRTDVIEHNNLIEIEGLEDMLDVGIGIETAEDLKAVLVADYQVKSDV